MEFPHPTNIKFTIRCCDLPPHNWDGHDPIWLGIQQGKMVEQEVRLPAEQVTFRADFRVAPGPNGEPNFLGPYAQGSIHDRFFYLCWGDRHMGMLVGFRRAKVPLLGLTWKDLESGHIEVTIRCTDKKGGPICATVKPEFLDWTTPTE